MQKPPTARLADRARLSVHGGPAHHRLSHRVRELASARSTSGRSATGMTASLQRGPPERQRERQGVRKFSRTSRPRNDQVRICSFMDVTEVLRRQRIHQSESATYTLRPVTPCCSRDTRASPRSTTARRLAIHLFQMTSPGIDARAHCSPGIHGGEIQPGETPAGSRDSSYASDRVAPSRQHRPGGRYFARRSQSDKFDCSH